MSAASATTAQKLHEYSLLAKHLANRSFSQETHPRLWEICFNQLFTGVLEFYLHHPGPSL